METRNFRQQVALLCIRLVDCVKSKLTEAGALDPQNLQEQIEVEDKNSHSFILGMLPRGKKFRQLVSEFEHYIECYIRPGDDKMLNSFLSQRPKGSRAANRRCLKWGDIRVDSIDKQFVDKTLLSSNTSLELNAEWKRCQLGYHAIPLIFATKVFSQVILEALLYIYHNRCKKPSMQTFLTSLIWWQRGGQFSSPSGRSELQNSKIMKLKFYNPALSMSERS